MVESVIFDLDGTLIDSADGIIAAYRRTIQAFGRGPLPDAESRRIIGTPTRQSLRTLLGEDRDLASALACFRQWFQAEGIYQAHCYDGIITALKQLRALQLRLLVCTVRPRPTAVQVMRHLGLTPFFAAIHGSEEDGRLESKQDLLSVLLAQHGLDAGSAVMVGDRSSDIVAARAHSMQAIAVTWGYGTLDELNSVHPFALCQQPGRLMSIVHRLMSSNAWLRSHMDRQQLATGRPHVTQ